MKQLSKTELDAPLPEKKVIQGPVDDDDDVLCDDETPFELVKQIEGLGLDEDDMD